MSLPLLIAFVVAQGQATPPPGQIVVKPIGQPTKQAAPPPVTPAPVQAAPPQQSDQPFVTPFVIAEQNRLAMTPKIDGKIDEEEWDPLSKSADMTSYFQWEPGKFFIAAVVPAGHDVVASFDLHANGWLHGKDNLEIRLTNSQGRVSVIARLMDATDINGPKWIDLPGFNLSSVAAVSTEGPNTVFEAKITDLGLGLIPTDKGTKMLMRMDDPLSTAPPTPPYLPRALSPVTLVMSRSAALPPGLVFNPEGVGRSSIAGESTHIRLAYNGSNAMKIQKLEMHSEGLAKADTIQQTVPFPKFDDKGRSYVDYNTNIMEGTPEGYRVLKGTLTTSDNVSAVMECSYRVGPLVDFSVPRQTLAVAPLDRSEKFAFYARSNSSRKVEGEVTIVVPEPLKVLNGADHKIGIYTNRGSERQPFELFFPPNASGTYPIKFVANVNGKKYEQTEYITIGGL